MAVQSKLAGPRVYAIREILERLIHFLDRKDQLAVQVTAQEGFQVVSEALYRDTYYCVVQHIPDQSVSSCSSGEAPNLAIRERPSNRM